MIGIAQLAWRYAVFNRTKTLILIACVFLTAFLPIAVRVLLSRFEQSIVRRADQTPAVIGQQGSPLDLVLHSLYFDRQLDQTVRYAEVANVRETGLATAVPVYSAATASSFPVVGTSLSYFEQRELRIADGESLLTLGDCVVGSTVAKSLNLAPGDRLLSDRENILDIAGKYPLKMHVVGVLASSGTADDQAVFVDLKTTWVIGGLGHGHQDLAGETDQQKIVSRDEGAIVASAAVLPFTEITPENLSSFHFHGEVDDFPISAVLAFTSNAKTNTLLQAKFDSDDNRLQMVRPSIVVRQLMDVMFRIKRIFDANAILIGVATLLLLILVVFLSARLRQPEMETLHKIGCARGTIVSLQLAELAIVFAVAAVLIAFASMGVGSVADRLIETWLGASA